MTTAVLGVAAGSLLIVVGVYACMVMASKDDDENGRG